MNNFEKLYPTKYTFDIAPEHRFDVTLIGF